MSLRTHKPCTRCGTRRSYYSDGHWYGMSRTDPGGLCVGCTAIDRILRFEKMPEAELPRLREEMLARYTHMQLAGVRQCQLCGSAGPLLLGHLHGTLYLRGWLCTSKDCGMSNHQRVHPSGSDAQLETNQQCTTCNQSLSREHYADGPWRHRQRAKRTCRNCNSRARVYQREVYRDPAHEQRTQAEKKEFKQQQEEHLRAQFQKMGLAEVERCQICGNEPAPGKPLQLDHRHGSFDLRGKLCGLCNRSLGNLGDNPASVVKMASYLVSAALAGKSKMVTYDVEETLLAMDGLREQLLKLQLQFQRDEQSRREEVRQALEAGHEGDGDPEDDDYRPDSEEEDNEEEDEAQQEEEDEKEEQKQDG